MLKDLAVKKSAALGAAPAADVYAALVVATDRHYGTGELLHALPYVAETYDDPRMPLMHETRRHGLEL